MMGILTGDLHMTFILDFACPLCPVHRVLLFSIVLVSCLALVSCSGGEDTDLGKRRFLWVGEICNNNEIFLDMIPTDPRFEIAGAVPCNLVDVSYEDAIRFTRIYLPRKYSDLVSYTDGALFHDFQPKVLTTRYIEWFRSAVEEGLGLCLVEFVIRVTPAGLEYWPETSLFEAFPADLINNPIAANKGRQFYKIVEHSPLVDFPGMENTIINWGQHGELLPKQGATTWAIWRGRKTPALVSRKYGEGMVLHYGHGWDTMPWEVKRSWRYLPDYIFNHLSFVTNLPFPEDLELTHEIRSMFATLEEQMRMAISVIEFIDKFGANPRPFEEMLSGMENPKQEAETAYMKGELTRAGDILRDVNNEVRQISNDMMKAKNRAMLWIFVIEWLAVTATGMICGFALWTIMVKKRLYKEVEYTRLSQR